MDKSSGVGSNLTHIKPETNDLSDPARSTEENKGAFNNKHVKTSEGTNTMVASKQATVELSNRDKKRLDQDYVISLKQSQQNNPILEPSVKVAPTTEIQDSEFYFVNSLTKQQVIDQFRNNQAPLTTICISSPKDLDKNGLIQETWLADGQLQTEKGRLFGDKPLTLIFDLTVMTPGDIASFNDMLQDNPSFNDKPLSPQVKRVCFVNQDMIKGIQASNPDLWRRLALMTQKEVPNNNQAQTLLSDDALLNNITTEFPPKDKAIVTIDFTLADDWYQLLFGGISVDENGRLVFVDGKLANISDDVHLIFKNAPWDSPDFNLAITTAYREGCFEANHQQVQLPKNITLTREDASQSDIEDLKDRFVCDESAFNQEGSVVCINSTTIENLKGQGRVEGDKFVHANKLSVLLKDCSQLAITSPLDHNQWLWLLTQIDQIPEDIRPKVFENLPSKWLVDSRASQWRVENDIEGCIKDLKSERYLKYDVTSNDSLDSLGLIHMTSYNNFTFSLYNSPLFERLKQGDLVVFNGLENNPQFAESIETLLLPNPYLFMNGHKIDLPKAKVALIKPSNKHAVCSSLFDQAFSTCPPKSPSPENPVYSLLKALPQGVQKKYPVTPPWHEAVFDQQFKEQAQLECELDGSDKLMPCHQRRALHILLAKAYRGDAKVYGFIKAKIAQYYPDIPESNQADRSALQQWLLKHPKPDLKIMKAHFWELAQHCPVSVIKSAMAIDDVDDQLIKTLASFVVGAECNVIKRIHLSKEFNIDFKLPQTNIYYDGILRSTLRDILAANKLFLKPGVVISQTVSSLEKEITLVLKGAESEEQNRTQIQALISDQFINDHLPPHYEDVPDAILANKRHSHAQQERRLTHLAQRVEKHPIVFLQGETGAGKTFMAQAIATKAGYPECQVMQLSPNQTAETLFGGLKLIADTISGISEQSTKFQEGIILQWARSLNPPLLVLDEANLAREGLLAPLAGLTQNPPVICYQGRVYKLSKKHRIILTGNPDYYEGRHLDNTLKSCVPTFFYHPLPESVLANSIIKPGLPTHWSDAMKQQASERLLVLFNGFQTLVPGDLTTPRDLKDVLATVRQILSHHTSRNTLSEKQVNALMRRAFMDSLGGAVTAEEQQRLTSLNLWYQGQFPEDLSVYEDVDRAFDEFLKQLQDNNPDANFRPLAIRQLVYRYWQNLDKDNSGRIAVVVEGPAGWGKDFVLKKVIKQWKSNQSQHNWAVKPYVHINANANQWSSLVEEVEKAMNKGQIIAISELNLIPSSYLEGLFNDVLTGDAKPGFRLFATINPGSFDGREAMSPALKSRCTQIKLGDLSRQELLELLMRTPYISKIKELPQWLTEHFHQLSETLSAQHSPVQLTLDNLFSTARYLAKHFSDQWPVAFKKHLSLAFQSLNDSLPSLQKNKQNLVLIIKE